MALIVYLFGLAIFIPILFWMVTFVYTSFRGSPYVPIKEERLKDITKFIKKGDTVADLGCGDARVMVESVKKGAKRVEGWELDAAVCALAKRNISKAKKNGLDTSSVKVHFGDYWNADVSWANVIYVYQMTKYMKPMKEKIISQLKKGTLIVSPDYEIPEMSLYKKIEDGHRGLYLYKV